MHNYLTCNKNLQDCKSCRHKAEKLCKQHGVDVQLVDDALTFAEQPMLKSMLESPNLKKVAKAEYGKYKAHEPDDKTTQYEEKLFQKLVQDCKKIIAKEHEDVIRRRHELGVRILQDEHKYVKHKWGSQGFIRKLALSIGVSKSTVYDAIKFAGKYADLEKFLTNQKLHVESLKWSYIVHNLLYEPKPKLATKPKPPVAKPPITETKPLSYLKPLSYIDEVPSVDEAKPEFDLIDEVLSIADNEENPLRRKILQRFLLEAVLKFDLSEEYYWRAWDFVKTQTGKEIADVDFTINFEHDRVVTYVSRYREKDSQEQKTVEARIIQQFRP